MKTKLVTFTRQWWFVLLFLGVYFVVINLVVLNRFWQFETYYFDHGIFDSALYQAAHLRPPLIDHGNSKLISQLGDHFTPTMYLLTPLYWLTDAYEPLLVAENLLVVASAFVLFIIAKAKIKGRFTIFTIIVSYCFFIGLQNAIIANFHTELIALLTLSLTLWALVNRRWKFFGFFLFLTLGTKETLVGIGIGVGIYLFFLKERGRGLAVLSGSALYYLLVTRLVIPFFSQLPYSYEASVTYDFSLITNLFLPPIKSTTMLVSFATFGALPVFAPFFLPAILQDFFVRFVLNSGSARWDLGLHYNATLAVLLAFGAILGAFKVEQKSRFLLAILTLSSLVLTVFFHRFLFHGPLALVFNPDFYNHTQNFDPLRQFLKTVPKRPLTMTQNNLASYLSHQTQVMLLRGNYWKWMPDVIVIDNHPGQNPNALWPSTEDGVMTMISLLDSDPNYKRNDHGGQRVYYEKAVIPNLNWYKEFKEVDQTQ